MAEHFDVIIVGAGLSGIGAGYHLQARCPDRSYAILEGREAIGGTWDLFRYPGIRSDSDMHTLGYNFRPWTHEKSIADGPSIREYVRDTARTYGIDRHIRFGHHVVSADWSSDEARWTVETRLADGTTGTLTCNFLYMCSGYYNYAKGHAPDFPGADRFAGRIVHPQFWPEDLDYAGKKVVVIGSGATAVTLVPEMAKTAAHVTMLQRSPTYVVSRPAKDRMANFLRRALPASIAYGITRWKNVLFQMFFYRLARKNPEKTKERLIEMVREQLGPGYDVDTHFTPRYNPWDQRLCLVPDADLFDTIRTGAASVETGTIETFTETGINLTDGTSIAADIIVTATGLEMQLLSDVRFTVDGVVKDLARSFNYKGMMYSDVPNLASCFGYTNASWTLKADLTSAYVCRLLNTMRRRGLRQCTPRVGDEAITPEPFLSFTSGYVQRALDKLPKQGSRTPWKLHQNYALDVMMLRFGSVDDSMEFSNPAPSRAARAA
ncbi:flavin-containing monooxygenase [Sphingomonas lycopersici]|uniref:NAD(P)/FAD-dependent oxidoreductase n=1 Tax=Sphingomonas lycopersici TaxID=2951807 RepID=A0AA42CTL1_9SPHN|nr:NAD(P)/FAD-dependent oxidoreductase [Sphingomonas lycopersici]MCW6534486.1 NAD(P)/FAD-dependent oxidoreductase [Sphingomonas lycopersici]